MVVGSRPVSAYTELTIEAPDIADTAAPGQFVAFAVGGPTSAMLLRRSIAIAGVGEGRISVVVSARAEGSTWLASRRPGDEVDVVGPLGRPFPLPPEGTRCCWWAVATAPRRWSGWVGCCAPGPRGGRGRRGR